MSAKKPKGLKLLDLWHDTENKSNLILTVESDGEAWANMGGEDALLDADQLDKLAVRCKEMAAYLRALPKSVTKKAKWEDV